MILHYTETAFRGLQRYKAQSIISILGIAIGFTAFILGGYWYYWEYSFDTFHPDWRHTYALTTSGLSKTAEGEDAEIHQLHVQAKKSFMAFPEIESFCQTTTVSWRPGGKEKQWMGERVDSTFFQFFRCDLLEGTYKGNAYDNSSVILTRRCAMQQFGTLSCVGETFKLNDNVSFTVAGVMKDYPQNTTFKFDYLLLGIPQDKLYVRVNPQADLKELESKINSYRLDLEDTEYNTYSNWRFHLRSLPEVHLRCSEGLESRFRNINILACAGALAFLSALMNLLVLFIGQQQRKMPHNLTYTVLGASFRSLTGKKLMELVLPLVIGLLLSLAFIELIFPYYQDYTRLEGYGYFQGYDKVIGRAGLLKVSVVLYLVAAVLFLLVSLLPVRALLRRRKQARSRLLRNSLIAGQIFIGALFLVASLGFYHQYRFMSQTDKGIVLDNIWQIDLGFDAVYSKDCRPFGELLRNNPYIEDVTALSFPVLSSRGEFYCSFISNLSIEGRGEGTTYEDNCMAVESNFLPFFGLRMKEGEWITNQGTYDYVVNETGARKLQMDHLPGRKIGNFQDIGEEVRISGVMHDYYFCPLRYPIDKTFFVVLRPPKEGEFYVRNQYYYIKVLPQNREKALEYAHKLYAEYDKGEIEPAKQFVYLPDLMEEFNRPEKSMFYVFSTLGLICILISSFGIYSLVSLSAEQRRKEIAIRKVNGAVYKDILSLFLKEYFLLVVLANALALPLGYLFIFRWLQTYAYHTELTLWFYAGIFLITCGVVVLSVARQVTYAVKVNPAEVVKSE